MTFACDISYGDTEDEGRRLVRVSVSESVYELVLGRAADFDAVFVQDLDWRFILTADSLMSHRDTGTRTIPRQNNEQTKRKESDRTNTAPKHIKYNVTVLILSTA